MAVNAAPASDQHQVSLLTFNVLAPIWAGAVWYPEYLLRLVRPGVWGDAG